MALPRHVTSALTMAALPWMVFILDRLLPPDLTAYGVRPREIEGLYGIIFSPFLHAGWSHLLANTGALFVLLLISLSYNRRSTYRALTAIILVGGGMVWLFGQSNSLHVGASGVVFGLVGFLIFQGVYRREWRAIVVSLLVAFLYGGTLLSLLVRTPGISWAGHFFGFAAGVLAASRGKRQPS